MSHAPDPNQAPTVANFEIPPNHPMAPKPAPAPAAPAAPGFPTVTQSTFGKLAESAPDLMRVVESMRAGQAPDPQAAARVMATLGSVVGGATAKAPAASAAPAQRSQAANLRDLLDQIGERVANMLGQTLPGVSLGITYAMGIEDPEIRIAAYMLDTQGQPIILAENTAQLNALGLGVYTTVAQAQEHVEVEQPPTVDTSHLLGQNF